MLLMQCSMQPGAEEPHVVAWNGMQLALRIMEEERPYIKPALMEGYSIQESVCLTGMKTSRVMVGNTSQT